jgi:hypothetical protein
MRPSTDQGGSSDKWDMDSVFPTLPGQEREGSFLMYDMFIIE